MATRRQQQWIVVGGIGGIAAIALLAANMTMQTASGDFIEEFDGESFDEAVIRDRTSSASPEMSWITQSSKEVEELTKSVAALRREITAMNAEHEAELAKVFDASAEQLLAMQQQLNALKVQDTRRPLTHAAQPRAQTGGAGAEIEQAAFSGPGPNLIGNLFGRNQNAPGTAGPAPRAVDYGQGSAQTTFGGTSGSVTSLGGSFGQEFTLASLPEGEAVAERKRLGFYLPPGSYAPATIISGVDASTGVTDQSNPIPVLMRITGPAISAGERSTKGAKTNLKGCTVTGSARGDLSAERVYVRLDTMTCIHNGFVVERDVAGFVAGSGKAGVRGPVVSREGDLVGKAAVAGALEGLAGAVGKVSEGSAESQDPTLSNLLKNAGAASLSGATENAASTLADYYINRAEQYQPVVSVYGGTLVEIVFMEGVDLTLDGE